MRLHGSILGALEHGSTWAALSALFAASSSEMWSPYQHFCVTAGIICGAIGILLRSPDKDRDDLKEEQCDE
jgi:hypothetical protein